MRPNAEEPLTENKPTSDDKLRSTEISALREPRWQFSIRGVLLLMLLMSVLLALIAPAIRSMSDDNVFVASVQMVIVILPTVIAFGHLIVQEKVSRTKGGALIATLYRPGARDRSILLLCATACTIFAAAIVILVLSELRLVDVRLLVFCTGAVALPVAYLLPQAIFFTVAGVAPGQIEFCRQGLIESGRHFIAPQRLTQWRVEGSIITLLLDADGAAAPGLDPWRRQVELTETSREDVLTRLRSWGREVP